MLLRILRCVAIFKFMIVGLVAATAADRPVYKASEKPVAADHNWSGWYAGVHAGYGWAKGETDIGLVDSSGTLQFFAAAGAFPVRYSYGNDGYVAGGQVGYAQQHKQWLWGVEADISATNVNGSQTTFLPPCGICTRANLTTVAQDMDWFGTLRLRGGHVTGNVLVYGTAGLAYGKVKYSYLQTNVPFGGALNSAGSDSKVEVGWTAGAGIEYGIGKWSAKLEYLYYDLGEHSFSVQHNLAPPGVLFVPEFQNRGSILRAGLNHCFN